MLQVIYCKKEDCKEPAHGFEIVMPLKSEQCGCCGHIKHNEIRYNFCSLNHMKEFLNDFEGIDEVNQDV